MNESQQFEEWFFDNYKRPYNCQDTDDNDIYLLWTIDRAKEVTA